MDERWEVERDSTLIPLLERAGTNPIEVTRNGEVVARIVPMPKRDIAKSRAAAAALRNLSAGLNLGPGLTIKDLINEGRKY
ncbi:hypothetical protein [uncultured Devosia sp.]|uniref:hypothetical protein n=1 Tax=uncultured Devosia sp. TaxID=211434 RepID=UPI0035CBD976